MPNIGTFAVNLHTVDRDETVYAMAGNTVSHVDNVALRRTLPEGKKKDSALRTQVRFERGFPVSANGVDSMEKSVTVSIAVTVPPGVTPADAQLYVKNALLEAAETAGNLAVSGDIHL